MNTYIYAYIEKEVGRIEKGRRRRGLLGNNRRLGERGGDRGVGVRERSKGVGVGEGERWQRFGLILLK